MERLGDEMKRARRYEHALSLLMFDLDQFKAINDAHGHVVGDRILREFSELMLRTARETDIVARYGGEEFAVLLTHTTAIQAERLANRIRRATEHHEFQKIQNGGIRVTASAGVATFPVNDRIAQPEDLVQAADDAMYRAKNSGRNRTIVDPRSIAPYV